MEKTKEIKVGGLDTLVISAGKMEIGIATGIGPRIIYLASQSTPEKNLFGVLPEAGVKTEEGFWKLYGGHRLWTSPEAKPRSYSLDNKPVAIKTEKSQLTISGIPEIENSTQKEITLKTYDESSVQVIHTIRNTGRWPVKLACWALSVMARSGFAIIPLKASKVDREGLLPDRRLSLWPYTSLADSRFVFAEEYVFLRQDPGAKGPVKIGAAATNGWAAYWRNGQAFVKKFFKEEGEYPDYGCNVEVYTNPDMLELETVGTLTLVNPGESVRHSEIWTIHETGDLKPEQEDVRKKLGFLNEKTG